MGWPLLQLKAILYDTLVSNRSLQMVAVFLKTCLLVICTPLQMTVQKEDLSAPFPDLPSGEEGVSSSSKQISEATPSILLLSQQQEHLGQHTMSADELVVDFFGTGSVIGEMDVLEKIVHNTIVDCETDVQVYRWPSYPQCCLCPRLVVHSCHSIVHLIANTPILGCMFTVKIAEETIV